MNQRSHPPHAAGAASKLPAVVASPGSDPLQATPAHVAPALPDAGPRLQVSGLAKRFGDFPVLDSVTLTVDAGEIVAVLGPSGCGKTTFLDILAGVTPADGGAIWWDGLPVTSLRGRVAYLQQRDLLLPWRSALANALLAAEIRGHKAAARTRAGPLFQRLGLAGFERWRPGQLSGGMRQRVALARTLLGGGDLWLLDEPFAAVDALTRQELHRLLKTVWEGQPAILVTHDVHEARRLAHRVVILSPRPARVIATLPARELSEERVVEMLRDGSDGFGHTR